MGRTPVAIIDAGAQVAEHVGRLRPDVCEIAELSTVIEVPVTGHRLAAYCELTLRVDAVLADHAAVVVTAVAAAVEELAYWLDLTVRSPKPVVVTGSSRPWDAVGSDGPMNLHNAVLLAASGQTTGFGAVVLVDGRVLPAREAVWTSTLPQSGSIGTVYAEHIRLRRPPERATRWNQTHWATPFDVRGLDPHGLPRVEIVYTYVDAAAETVCGLLGSRIAGVVLAGEPSPTQLPVIRRGLDRGVVFVACDRNGFGAIYDSAVPGVVCGEDLMPHKARLLLLLALGVAGDPGLAVRLFTEHLNPHGPEC